MKKLILLLALFISLPCLAADTFEVYYPSTMRIINTGFNDGSSVSPRVFVDGLDGNKRVLYTGCYVAGIGPRDNLYSFTFIPSKNIKGKIVVNHVEK